MFSSPRYLRRPLMALVALFAALLTASEAAACSSTKSDGQGCATACGCCSPAAIEAPLAQAEVARLAVIPQTSTGCESSPGAGCVCRSDVPAAPSQKPGRTTAEGRPEHSQGSDFVQLGEVFAARTALTPQVPSTQSPPKVPLYLRNERLLF